MISIVLSVVIFAAELVLWYGARRNRYGRAADGALLVAAIGWAGLVFVPDEQVANWSIVAALLATLCLTAMAFNKAELR